MDPLQHFVIYAIQASPEPRTIRVNISGSTMNQGHSQTGAVILCLLILLAGAGNAVAQAVQTGIIDGIVLDEQNSPVGGSFITILSRGVNAQKVSTISDFEGRFRVPGLPPGVYYVTVQLEGYYQQGELRVNLRVNQVQNVVIKLREGINQDVYAPEAEVFLNSLFTEPFQETLPISPMQPQMTEYRLLDREWVFSDFKHVNGSEIIDDMAAGQIEFNWDGVLFADPWDGEPAYDPRFVPFQELDIRSRYLHPGDATPAGTLHYKIAEVTPGFHGVVTAGGQLNFQIGDDVLSNDLDHNEGWIGLSASSFDSTSDQGILFTGYGGLRLSNYLIEPLEERFSTRLVGDARFVNRLSEGSELSLRGIYTLERQEGYNSASGRRWQPVAPYQLSISDTLEKNLISLSGSLRQRLSENITISYRINADRISREILPTNKQVDQSTTRDSQEGLVYDGTISGANETISTNRLSGVGDIEFFLDEITGTHQIRVGIDAAYAETNARWGYNGSVLREFRDDRLISRTFYFDQSGERFDPVSFSTLTRFSIFARDNWLISPRLMVNIGIRFDATDVENTTTRVIDWNAISPRIGISFDVFNDGSLILRTGVARYFDQALVERTLPDPYGRAINYQEAALDRISIPDQLTAPSLTRDLYGYDGAWRPADLGSVPPRTDEVFTSIEYSPNDRFIASLDYSLRETDRILDDMDVALLPGDGFVVGEFLNWTERSAVDSRGQDYSWYEHLLNSSGDLSQLVYWGNDGRLYRSYHRLRFRASLAVNQRFTLRGLLSLGSARGNIDVTTPDVGSRSIVQNSPAHFINSEGYLKSHQPLRLLLVGTYRLSDTTMSLGVSWTSGTPYDRFLYNPAFSSLEYTIRADPRGEVYRHDGQLLLDARIERAFYFGGDRLSAGLEIRNLLDDRTVVQVDQRDLESFGIPLEVNPPRQVGLPISYQF